MKGDILVRVDEVNATGATMGTVVDALRGKPGDKKMLVIERNGKEILVEARVERVL
jgi:C-terminal processing protease CtpA/Prc